jgi:hypothetical protein
VDLPLSNTLWKLILGRPVTFYDLRFVNGYLYKTLNDLYKLSNAFGKSDTVDSMYLCFTLPGYDDIELVEGGALTAVTIDNVGKFVELASERTLGVVE